MGNSKSTECCFPVVATMETRPGARSPVPVPSPLYINRHSPTKPKNIYNTDYIKERLKTAFDRAAIAEREQNYRNAVIEYLKVVEYIDILCLYEQDGKPFRITATKTKKAVDRRTRELNAYMIQVEQALSDGLIVTS